MTIARIGPDAFAAAMPDLAAILVDCVCGGASVNFVLPFDDAQATLFFERIGPAVASGSIVLFGAWHGATLVGTVQLVPAHQPNQRHRGEVAKLLVPRHGRGRGVGRALMAAVEDEARRRGLTLLTLDTAAASNGDRLYRALGWTPFGVVPGYACNPDGQPKDCAFFYKMIAT